MMPTTIREFGYLETPYLSEFPYLNPSREDAFGLQFDVTSYVDKLTGIQIEQKIIAQSLAGIQFNSFITQPRLLGLQHEAVHYDQYVLGLQHEQIIEFDGPIGLQFLSLTEDVERKLGIQYEQIIAETNVLGWQMLSATTQPRSLATQWIQRFYFDKMFGVQFLANLIEEPSLAVSFEGFNPTGEKIQGLEFRASENQPHIIAGDYLNDEPYLSEYQYCAPVRHVPVGVQFDGHMTKEPPLATQFEGVMTKEKSLGLQFEGYITKQPSLGVQFHGFLTKEPPLATQFEGVITKEKKIGLQFEGYITKEPPLALQFTSVYELAFAVQFKSALYNTTNLRVLMDFPSRGTDGQNWSATSTAPSASNAFNANNLNTDIVEQYWRSESGVTNATITCDTQLIQGVYNDTVGILSHNLTGSATVRMQASNQEDFGLIEFDTPMDVDPINMYYIAPTLPLLSFRYWRFIINDPGSRDGFLRIGTLVFGSSMVFTNESFVDQVRFGKQQFVDKVYTEGFTNVSNDRGKKSFLELQFKSIRYGRFNWSQMDDIFRIAGVTLKCLWIPVPSQPQRFTVFGKLNELPSEEHNYKGVEADYVDFNIRVDEAL
jgi:hypothetical protein